MESIIQSNLMTREGYSPYCGADRCFGSWPRTQFDGNQFKCPMCGWRSQFDVDFINRYKAKWNK